MDRRVKISERNRETQAVENKLRISKRAMRYQEFRPHPILSKYIECFRLLEGNDEKSILEPQRILPDGCIELLFHFKSRNRRFTSDSKTVDEPRSFINGQIKRYIMIEPTGALAVWGIRFRPSGAYPFLLLPTGCRIFTILLSYFCLYLRTLIL